MQLSFFDIPAVSRPPQSGDLSLGKISRFDPDTPLALSAVVDFDDVPHALLATANTSQLAYKPDVADKNLWKLLGPFMGGDEFRSNMDGLNVDAFGIVATEGHRLVLLPHKDLPVSGFFAHSDRAKKDERFPDYENAIPAADAFVFSCPVNVRALRSYLQAALLFVNETAKQIPVRVQNDTYMAFNGRLLGEVMLFFEQLGEPVVYAHFIGANRPVVFSVEPKFSLRHISKPAILLMPVVMPAGEGDVYNDFPYDFDWQRGLRAVWSFGKNSVQAVPAPGSGSSGRERVYQFDAARHQWSHPLTPSDQLPPYVFAALKSVLVKNAVVPMIEQVKKEGDQLLATGDMQLYYAHRNPVLLGLPDGMYRLVKNKALLPDTDNPVDFPKPPDFLPGSKAAKASFEPVLVGLSVDAFRDAVAFVSVDALRPAMTGVALRLLPDVSQMEIVSTDGHLLYRRRFEGVVGPAEPAFCVVPAKAARLHGLIAAVSGLGQLRFTDQGGTLNYRTDELPQDTVRFRMVDAPYPNYREAIPRQTARRLFLRPAQLLDAIGRFTPPKDKDITWKLANKGGNWVALKIKEQYGQKNPPPPELLETVPLPVDCTLESGEYEADLDGLLVMPVENRGLLSEYDIVFYLELMRRALVHYAPSDRMVLATTAPNRGAMLYPAGALSPGRSPASPSPAVGENKVDGDPTLLLVRARTLVLVQRQRLRLLAPGLSGADRIRAARPVQLSLFGLDTPPDQAVVAVVGDIPPPVAAVLHRQAGVIVLQVGNGQFGLKHIVKRHQAELDAVGLSAEEFVERVCGSYTEIRKGNAGALLLVKRNGSARLVIVRLKKALIDGQDAYSVESAYIVNDRSLKKSDLLWSRETDSGSTDTTPLGLPFQATKPGQEGKSRAQALGQSKSIRQTLNGPGEVPDADYPATYGRVRHLIDEKTRQAHAFYALETDDFTDLERLYADGDVTTDWQRHKRDVAALWSQLAKNDSVQDGYENGRQFVGRHQRQTAGLDLAEIAKLVRQELAAEYPDGAFSVRIDRFSGGQSLDVNITDLSFDPFSAPYRRYLLENTVYGRWLTWAEENYGRERLDIYNERAGALIKKVEKIVSQYNYDNSDPQTDYFNVRFYGHVRLSDRLLILKYYPASAEGNYFAESDAQYAARQSAQSKQASERKGQFKKWQVVYYTRATGQPDRRGFLPDGRYPAVILRSPNGRSAYGSSYDIALLRPIGEVGEEKASRLRAMTDRYRGQYLFEHDGGQYVRDDRWGSLERINEKHLQASAPDVPVPASMVDASVLLRAKVLVLVQRQRLRLGNDD